MASNTCLQCDLKKCTAAAKPSHDGQPLEQVLACNQNAQLICQKFEYNYWVDPTALATYLQACFIVNTTDEGTRGRVLDIGAGDGGVTTIMAPYFEHVVATESDAVMRWRLRRLGYTCYSPEDFEKDCSMERFDVITCFNVLDRCDSPRTLLLRMRAQLQFQGLIMLAVVFPFQPFVEKGARKVPPKELILVDGATLEEMINSFVQDTLLPCGLCVEKISRAPYLCEGDSRRLFYLLNDVIFVLRPT